MEALTFFVSDICGGYVVEGLDINQDGKEDVLNKYRDCRFLSSVLNRCIIMIDHVPNLVHC